MASADKHERKANRHIEKATKNAGNDGKFWGHMNKAGHHNQRAETKRWGGK